MKIKGIATGVGMSTLAVLLLVTISSSRVMATDDNHGKSGQHDGG